MMTKPAVRLSKLNGTVDDVRAVHEVLACAPGYSIAVSGALPSPEDAASLLTACPPDLPKENKHVYGIYSDTQLVGIADVLRGYPSPEVAYIGLLLIAERFHGKGLGLSSYECICQFAKSWSCRRIRLAVVEANDSARGFWQRCGFSDTGVRVPYQRGTVFSQSMIFELALPDGD